MTATAPMVFWWKLWLPWWIFIKLRLSHYNGDTVSVNAALESHPSFLMAEFCISVFASNHYPQYIPNRLFPNNILHKRAALRTMTEVRIDCSFPQPILATQRAFISKHEAFSRGYVICWTKWIVYLTSIWSRSGRSDNIQRPTAIWKTNV